MVKNLKNFKKNICIVGGLGHVGLPLGISFASKGFVVNLLDRNLSNKSKVLNGKMPFIEYGAEKLLKKYKSNLNISNNYNIIKKSKYVIVCVGTPVDKKDIPQVRNFLNVIRKINKFLCLDQHLIIRSSVYPGTLKKIKNILKNTNNLTYCPERIAQGYAIKELPHLTQIISGNNKLTLKEISKIFKKICKKIIICSFEEAEFIKLFSNTYRYINFSISNQFYMMSRKIGLDFHKMRRLMKIGYIRNSNIPSPGFTAGPCLHKDTIQLSHYFKHHFPLGKSAKMINENLPNFLVEELKKDFDLKKIKLGILGISFKANVDDIRDSLSIKLINLLKPLCRKIYIHDPFVKNLTNINLKELLKLSDIIIIATPHDLFKSIKIPSNKKIIDIWNFL